MATRRKARKATSRRKPVAASALRRARAERDEALKFQAATGEILKVIRGSPSDAQPVFEMIVRNAVSLCNGFFASAFRYDGERLHLVATSIVDPAVRKFLAGQYPRPPDKAQMSGRAILARKVVRMEDALADPLYDRRHAEIGSWRRMLGVPMMDQDEPIGAIVVSWADAGPIPKAQEELLKTFADQAVIAIENVRLFNETKASLEQQKALGEVLRIVSRTVTDAQPAFDAILGVVLHLFPTFDATVWLVRDRHLVPVARGGPTVGRTPGQRVPVTRDYFHGWVILDRRAYSVDNVAVSTELSELSRADLLSRERRAILMVPLMRRGEAIGAISVSRAEPFPFSPRQVALLGNFADQAVIAIENARLFNETKEALERQTATAEVLRVIAGMPADPQPVFHAIVESGMRIFDGMGVGITLVRQDGQLELVASSSPESRRNFPMSINRESANGTAILEQRVVNIADTKAVDAPALARSNASGFRAIAVAPLMRQDTAIGALSVTRKTPGPLSEKQIALLRTFADQAVIAIENARLFNETKEALERQTATAEVLKVISGSPADVGPVFDAILKSAVSLCGAELAAVFAFDGRLVHLVATHNWPREALEYFSEIYPSPPSQKLLSGRTILTKSVVQITDSAADSGYDPNSVVTGHWRRMLGAPMLREGRALGAFVVAWRDPGETPQRQVELLQTFADQAAIAIENVRLFNETKEALEKQTATAEILRVISTTPTDTAPVFDAIVRHATRLCEAAYANVFRYDGERLHWAASDGWPPELLSELKHAYPTRPNRKRVAGRVILEGRAVELEDTHADADYDKALGRSLRYRRILGVPLLREGRPLGVITVGWEDPGPIEARHADLLHTFADQAVIAIENVRLFNETKDALEQQTATSEILQVIRGSATDIQPVFDALAANAARLCEANDAILQIREGDALRFVAHHGDIPNLPPGGVRPLSRNMVTGRAVLEGLQIHVADLQLEAADFPEGSVVAKEFGYRTILATPLMRDGTAIGAIMIRRREARAFSDKHLALVKTFADQAVIAIENVRLFNETKEALEQQKASADVLQVISNSIADTKPVFEMILESCRRLFGGHDTGIGLVGEDGLVHLAAHRGPMAEALQKVFPVPLSSESGTGSAILEKAVKHYPDVFGDPGVPEYVRRSAAKVDFKSVIFAPMYWEGNGIGAIWVGRSFVGAFSEKQFALLKTFADQAVIAIQNARLFREIQEKSAQLEVANKHKSDFLANMSHELRTPLNAIIGFSEVLLEKMFGEVNEKQTEYLKDIYESGRHLLSLINDILDLSKIEAGRMELELSTFDLPSAVSNAMTLVRERAQRHGIRLGLEMDSAVGALEADERKVKQILLNLLSNAVKFTPDGGKVDVLARKMDGKVEIAVRDTGIGIATEDHAAVFEEFKQVGRDITRKAEGTGLGLALTKRLVELHGGEIALESAPGKGSTFTVRLPLR